jgi:hypothetical protein
MHYTPKQLRLRFSCNYRLPVSPCDLVIRSLEAAPTLYLEDIAAEAELDCAPGTFRILPGGHRENEIQLKCEEPLFKPTGRDFGYSPDSIHGRLLLPPLAGRAAS